jgi:hypothetical protein
MKEQDIPYKQLEVLGLDTKALTQEDISRLLRNEKTEVRAFSIEYTKDREDFLKNENIKYNIREDGGKKKLEFEGRIAIEANYYAQNTPETIELLKKANIQYEQAPENEKLLKLKDALLVLAVLDNPLIGAAISIYYLAKVIPKRLEVKNDMGLSRSEIKQLKNSETIQHKNERNEIVLMQFDKATNSISSVKQTQINPPDEILGQKLTPQDKIHILMGETVQLKNGIQIQLNLLRSNGIEYKDSKGKEISFDVAKHAATQQNDQTISNNKHQMKV